MKIKEAAINYVGAKIALTNCMQKHFRQLCQRCKYWNKCLVYSKYVQAWMDLQESLK